MAARIAPAECLFYMSSAGMATPDAKSGNQTEQLLAEPEVRQMVAELRRAVTAGLAQAMKKQDVPETISAEKVVDLAMVPLTKPLALYVSSFEMQPGGPAVRGGVMVNLGDEAAKTEAALAQRAEAIAPDAHRIDRDGRPEVAAAPAASQRPGRLGLQGQPLVDRRGRRGDRGHVEAGRPASRPPG